MPLMKGAQDPAQQQQEGPDLSQYTDAEQRKIKTGLIIIKLRRYWRILCIIGFLVGFVYLLVTDFAHFSFGTVIELAIVTVLYYAVFLFLFLYIGAGFTLRAFFFLKDLFGGSKNTKL